MLTLRQWHGYIGAFIAPSVLFFAFTGALQLFSLHEAHGAYAPPAALEALGRIHKNQTWQAPPRARPAHGDDPERHAGLSRHRDKPASPWPVMALKWLFLTVAVGLMASTLLGLWMALSVGRRRGVMLGLTAAGIVLPLLLLVLA
jgi:hypothetical protein